MHHVVPLLVQNSAPPAAGTYLFCGIPDKHTWCHLVRTKPGGQMSYALCRGRDHKFSVDPQGCWSRVAWGLYRGTSAGDAAADDEHKVRVER